MQHLPTKVFPSAHALIQIVSQSKRCTLGVFLLVLLLFDSHTKSYLAFSYSFSKNKSLHGRVANVLRQVSNRYCPTNVYSIPHNHNSTKSCLSCSFLLFQTLQTPSDPCHYKRTYNCRQRMSSTPRYPIHFEQLLLPNFQSEIVYVVYQRQVPL